MVKADLRKAKVPETMFLGCTLIFLRIVNKLQDSKWVWVKWKSYPIMLDLIL